MQVLADDADIFVLLVYFIWYYKPLAYISMRKYNGNIIHLIATAAKLGNKCSDLLPVHAESYIIDNHICLNCLSRGKCEPSIGCYYKVRSGFKCVCKFKFKMDANCCCMGGGGGGWVKATESLNDLRHRIFGNTKEPTKYETYHKLEHTKRARLQVLVWRAVDDYNIPRLEDYSMVPIHGNVYVAPNVHLQHVSCGCKTKETCSCRSTKCHARHIVNVKQMNSVQMTM